MTCSMTAAMARVVGAFVLLTVCTATVAVGIDFNAADSTKTVSTATAVPTQRGDEQVTNDDANTSTPTTALATVTVTSTSSTTTSIGDACGGVPRCLAHAPCAQCLAAINASLGIHSNQELNALVLQGVRLYQFAFVRALVSTEACSTIASPPDILHPALIELHHPSCMATFGMAVTFCADQAYRCFADADCGQCISKLYVEGSNKTGALATPVCIAALLAQPSMLLDLQQDCRAFPDCTLTKFLCEFDESGECQMCLAMFQSGDGARAARACSSESYGGQQLEALVEFCSFSTQTACDFLVQRCTDTPHCGDCLAVMGNTNNARTVADDLNSTECIIASQNPSTADLLLNVALACPDISTCWRTVSHCAYQIPTWCVACLQGDVVPDGIGITCDEVFERYEINEACASCPQSVHTTNLIVLATAVVGGISAAICVAVLGTILAYDRDLVSMRDRIVIGLLLANTMYSIANTFPLNARGTGPTTCGRSVMSFDAMRFGRAWWFSGKYALVSFELLILWASIRALVSGASAVPRRTEVVLYATCIIVAASTFAVFYIVCAEVIEDGYNSTTETIALSNTFYHDRFTDDKDDDEPSVAATQRFQNGRDAYDNLVRDMLVAWDALVGVAVILWVVLRMMYVRAIRALRTEAVAAALAEETDVWASTRRSAWEARRQMLDARRRAFGEVAKPLEPFIAIFVAFAAPAIVMSTSYCQENSGATLQSVNTYTSVGASESITYGMCDVVCEFVLAFRTLGTVFVYLLPRERRVELVSVRTTWRKLCARVMGCFGQASRHTRGSSHTLLDSHFDADVSDHEMLDIAQRHAAADNASGDDSGVRAGAAAEAAEAAALAMEASWQISERDIAMVRRLGQGAFGEVWEGRLQPHDRAVAIKVLLAGRVDDDGDAISSTVNEEFRKECLALVRLDSPHLLKFVGFGRTNGGGFFIVTELMAGGSLESVLHDQKCELAWRMRVSIGLQVALGMEHLHLRNMVHRDLKSANVLLDEHLKAKVCDFGLTRVTRPHRPYIMYSAFTGFVERMTSTRGSILSIDTAAPPSVMSTDDSNDYALAFANARGTMTKAAGTLLWMAPEVFRGDTQYGPEVDVYSYGILLWELATRMVPWSELYQSESSSNTAFFEALNRALQTGQRPTVPSSVEGDCSPRFLAIMSLCWVGDPADRPLFSEVAKMMAQCLHDDYNHASK